MRHAPLDGLAIPTRGRRPDRADRLSLAEYPAASLLLTFTSSHLSTRWSGRRLDSAPRPSKPRHPQAAVNAAERMSNARSARRVTRFAMLPLALAGGEPIATRVAVAPARRIQTRQPAGVERTPTTRPAPSPHGIGTCTTGAMAAHGIILRMHSELTTFERCLMA